MRNIMPVKILFLVLLFCLLNNTAAAEQLEKHIKFLGKTYSRAQWRDIKSMIHCMTNRGTWTNTGRLSGLIYQSPCYWARYVQGKCETANLHANMTGLDYTWTYKNHTCSISGRSDITVQPFNHDAMCKLIDKKSIMILGDSISDEFFFSLGSALIQSKGKCMDSGEMHVGYVGVGGTIPYQQFHTNKFGCSSTVVTYLRHDYFVMSEEGDTYPHMTAQDRVFYGAGWPHIVEKLGTDLLIVNRGAHFVEDDVVIKEVDETLTALTKKFGDKLSIIFRSSVPGHADYNERRYEPPLKHKPVMKADGYNWHRFEKQNELIRALLHEKHEHVLFLDIFPATVLRPDGHTTEDALHYCIPGPIDQWVVFFYNVLNILDKA